MSPGSTVLFGALPKELKLSSTDKRSLTSFVRLLSRRIVEGRAFDCLITGDAELRRLNKTFLSNDYATDVLSFPSYGTPGANTNGDPRIGEIAISIQQADLQAHRFGHSRLDEIRILMVHGLLHLAGMDHEMDRGEMARAERQWRAEFGLPPGLLARSRVDRKAAGGAA